MPIIEKTKISYYIIDIETRPNQELQDLFNEGIKAPKNIKDPDKIKDNLEKQKLEARKDMAIDIDYSEIVCIGVKEIGAEAKHLSLEELDELLTKTYASGGIFITYNGKVFDFPIIIRALLKKGLTGNVKWLKDMCGRYNVNSHIDLIEVLNNFGKYKSLDELVKIYVGKGKKEIDFNTATEEDIKSHNLECLSFTEQLFNYFKPII